MKKLLHRKAHFLTFHKILPYLLKLLTLYRIPTSLWMMRWKLMKPLAVLPQLLYMIKKNPTKNKFSAHDFSMSPKRNRHFLVDPAFSTWNAMLRTLKSSSKLDLHRNGSLTPQLLTEKLEFQPQLTSFYMVSKPYKFQFYPNCNNDHYILYASVEIAAYVCWTANVQKIFNLQTILLERSVFDLHTDDSIPNFQSSKKNVSIMRHSNIFGTIFLPTSRKFHLSKKEVQLSFSVHLFCNLKAASSIGSLRIYVPLKQYYFSRKIFSC